jgi:hypothetical protein
MKLCSKNLVIKAKPWSHSSHLSSSHSPYPLHHEIIIDPPSKYIQNSTIPPYPFISPGMLLPSMQSHVASSFPFSQEGLP